MNYKIETLVAMKVVAERSLAKTKEKLTAYEKRLNDLNNKIEQKSKELNLTDEQLKEIEAEALERQNPGECPIE